MTKSGWEPPQVLLDNVRMCLAHAPRATAEDRFEAWAWRALLDEDGPGLLTRHAAPSHMTASALVLSPDAERVCLVLHGKLKRWVQPGGHLEPGDQTLAGAAAREVLEETGLKADVLPIPVRLSRHLAPCRPGVVDWHLDVQFAAISHDLVPAVSEESFDVQWFDVADLLDQSDPHPNGTDLGPDDVRSNLISDLAEVSLPRAIEAVRLAEGG